MRRGGKGTRGGRRGGEGTRVETARAQVLNEERTNESESAEVMNEETASESASD